MSFPDNVGAPWLNFEAGAISKSLEVGKVAPFVVGIAKGEITGPLSQFQITEFDREDVLRLVKSINKASGQPRTDDEVSRSFNICWPSLETGIHQIELPAHADELDADHAEHGEKISTLERNIHEGEKANDPDALDEVQQKILKLIFDSNKGLSTEQVSAHLSIELGLIEYHFDTLMQKKLLNHPTLSMGGTWGRGRGGGGGGAFYPLSQAGRKYVVEVLGV